MKFLILVMVGMLAVACNRSENTSENMEAPTVQEETVNEMDTGTDVTSPEYQEDAIGTEGTLDTAPEAQEDIAPTDSFETESAPSDLEGTERQEDTTTEEAY